MSEPTFMRLPEGPATRRYESRTALAIASTGRGWRELARDLGIVQAGPPAAPLGQHLARALRAAATEEPDLTTTEAQEMFALVLDCCASYVPTPHSGNDMADVPLERVLLEVEDVALRRILVEITDEPIEAATALTATSIVFPGNVVPSTLRTCPRTALHVDYGPTGTMARVRMEAGAWAAWVPLPGWAVQHHPDTPPDAVHSWFDFIDMARCFARYGHVQ